MSKLLVRPLKADDWTWLNTAPENVRLDKRGVDSLNAFTFICEEADKPVGVAMGRATKGETCYLDYIRANRWDIFYALMRRHAQNGIDTGHKYALARIPRNFNCTGLGDASALTARLSADVRLAWKDEGFDTDAKLAAAQKTEPVELKALLEYLDTWLKANGVTVTYG